MWWVSPKQLRRGCQAWIWMMMWGWFLSWWWVIKTKWWIYVFSELENDIVDGEPKEHETQYHMDDHNAHDDLLNRYECDNKNCGPMKNFENEHLFSRMSHVLGGEIFINGTEPVEFKVRQVLKFFNLLYALWRITVYNKISKVEGPSLREEDLYVNVL